MRCVRAGHAPLFGEDFYQSEWTLTSRCNDACSYCVNRDERRDGGELPRELMLQTLEYLRHTGKPRYQFTLTGGETTLYPYLTEMLRAVGAWFRHARCAVTLLSNGSASAQTLRALLRAADPVPLRFIVTLHAESGGLDERIAAIASFSETERAKHFFLKIIAAPDNMPVALKTGEALDAAGIRNWRMQPVLDFRAGSLAPGYTRRQLALLADLAAKRPVAKHSLLFNDYARGGVSESTRFTFVQGVEQGLLRYQGMYCAAGRTSLYVNPFGKIAKGQFCGAMGYTAAEKNPFADPAFVTAARCTASHCTCSPYSRLPKWREAAYAPEYIKGNAEV